MCPEGNSKSTFKNRECYYKPENPNVPSLRCLNRQDLGKSMFHSPFHSSSSRSKQMFPLNDFLEYNITGFQCSEDVFIPWTDDDWSTLFGTQCYFKNNLTMYGGTLLYRLNTDLSFKNRSLIPKFNR